MLMKRDGASVAASEILSLSKFNLICPRMVPPNTWAVVNPVQPPTRREARLGQLFTWQHSYSGSMDSSRGGGNCCKSLDEVQVKTM